MQEAPILSSLLSDPRRAESEFFLNPFAFDVSNARHGSRAKNGERCWGYTIRQGFKPLTM